MPGWHFPNGANWRHLAIHQDTSIIRILRQSYGAELAGSAPRYPISIQGLGEFSMDLDSTNYLIGVEIRGIGAPFSADLKQEHCRNPG
jgi:hypothetical protein